MSDITRRLIEIYIDVDQGKLSTSAGGSPKTGEPFTLWRNGQTIIRATLRNKDLSAFTPPTGVSWFFALDNSYDPTIPDPVYTNDDEFNLAEDWTEVDPVNGKICWRINCATTNLAARFVAAGNTATLSDVKGELWMIPTTASPSLVCQWDITMRNIVSAIESDTTLVYSTSNLIKQVGSDTVIYFPDGTEAFRYSK